MICLKDVSRIYNVGLWFRALNGISFEVGDNEFVSITGPSGSGKTTLLNLIGALDKPTSGSIYYNDVDLTTLSADNLADYRRNIIGFVFQSFNLFPQLTALENVIYPLIPYQKGKIKNIKDRAIHLLETVGLESKADHLPANLSGGEAQRVAVARALINEPKLILADEPTGNLDSTSGQKVFELLRELSKNTGISVILVTHEANLASMADRMIRLVDGKITEQN